ncbi:hypothetical protein [Pararhodobacter sp. SW119]|uniref:hypothetical protein n=1 Tax=Pararhodobacter sp. SW119 TaxID=2780075 RepID=UPI001ADF2932|nr:hypothetical protein [Pararhodobacter sp. SW119]
MTKRYSRPPALQPDALDALLAREAARAPDPVSDALRARLLSDALTRMPPPRPGVAQPRRGFLVRIWQAIGGVPGFAGMATAGLAGVWIGAADPDSVSGLSTALWQGAALVNPDLADWQADAPDGFEIDPLLALLQEN